MKKIVVLLMACLVFFSCKEDLNLKPYDGPDYIKFKKGTSDESKFSDATGLVTKAEPIFSGAVGSTATVWLSMELMGKLSSSDRQIRLEQFDVTLDDYYRAFTLTNKSDAYDSQSALDEDYKPATVGVNYVTFDDPTVAAQMILPAGQIASDIPVVVVRAPAAGQGKKGTILGVRLVDSETLIAGNKLLYKAVIKIPK